ncbi:MAG: hypothetical protein AB7K04_04635 [Pseudorhodoplanes sp.]
MLAQQSPATRVAGVIEKIDGSMLTLKSDDGPLNVKLRDDLQVLAIGNGSLADVKPGRFIGVGAMPQPDGSQRAIQVMIFAEALRGLGEGHRPWDRPGATMTNATVAETVASVDGEIVMVKYKDGEKKIVIPPDSVIRVLLPADRNEVKVGAAVAVTGTRNPDGSVEAARMSVGRDGVVPR